MESTNDSSRIPRLAEFVRIKSNSSGIMSLAPIGKGDAALFDNVIQTNFKAQPSTEVPK